MNIPKAIENIRKLRDGCDQDEMQPYIEACNLGIEALKAVQNARANNYYTPIATMPGETEGVGNEPQ